MREETEHPAPVEEDLDDEEIKALPDAEQVHYYAVRGVPAEVIRQLVLPKTKSGKPLTAERFNKRYARALRESKARADRTVAESLFKQASGGKCHQMTLAYARQHLGWGEETKNADSASEETSAAALSALRALFDQFAADKAGRAAGADAVAPGGAGQPASARG